MNAISQVRRLELECREEARDDRPEWMVLRDLVRAHRANQERLNALCSPSVSDIDVVAFREAEKACERSYSDLAVAIEDAFCVPAAELARALS